MMLSDDEMSHEEECSEQEEPPKKKKCTVSYDRCRKPFSTHLNVKCSTKSLRTVPQHIVAAFNNKFKIEPPLSHEDRVCFKCRKELYDKYESEESSQSVSENVAQSSENTPNICDTVDMLMDDQESVTDVPVDQVKMFIDVIENLKRKYNSEGTTKSEKIQILTCLPLSWSYNEIKKHFNTSDYFIRISKKLQTEAGPLSMPSLKPGYVLSDELKQSVIEFYKSEDNVYILPGKKDCVRYKDDEGNVRFEQKRLVLCSLKELYILFCNEIQPNISIGFSSFAKLRPKCCILAGKSGTHSVCVCSIHQNVKLIITGCNLDKITRGYDYPISNYKDILHFIICEKNKSEASSKCYFGDCKECPGIDHLQSYLSRIFEEKEIEEVQYTQWISTPKTVLKNIVENTSDFIPSFCEQIEKLLPHAFVSKQQSNYFRMLKSTLHQEEIIVCLDFAENYAFVVQNAPPGFHWNNDQATVFVFYYYYKEEDILKGKGFVVISDNLNHDTVAVYTYQKLFMNYLKEKFTSIRRIQYFSDGAPQQFKNYKNILNLYYHNEDFNVSADWHFFPTAHGKGACDGVGGTVKRNAAKASLVLPPNEQILTPKSLFEWSKNHGNYDNVDFVYSPVAEYNKNVRKLNNRFKNTSRIKELQKQHSISPLTNGKVRCKIYSSDEEYVEMQIIDV